MTEGGGSAIVDSKEADVVEPESVAKRCPRCAENIKVEQLFCHYCGQQFAVRRRGYCTTCHQRVGVDSGTACPTCGNDVVDVIVESEALDAPPPAGETASLPLAQLSAASAEGPGPEGAAVPMPAARTPNWRRVLIAAAISLLASGLMIAASFMPWLGSEGGRTLSGWDLYEFQRDSGNDVLIIWNFFTDPSDGSATLFFTGLATLISGLALAGLTVVFLALHRLVRPEGVADHRSWVFLIAMCHVLALIVALGPPLLNLSSYFQFGGAASGASLEYGLILLWAATVVGGSGSLFSSPALSGLGSRARPLSSAKVTAGEEAGTHLPGDRARGAPRDIRWGRSVCHVHLTPSGLLATTLPTPTNPPGTSLPANSGRFTSSSENRR